MPEEMAREAWGGEAGLEVEDLDSVQPKTQRTAVLDIREEELGVA